MRLAHGVAAGCVALACACNGHQAPTPTATAHEMTISEALEANSAAGVLSAMDEHNRDANEGKGQPAGAYRLLLQDSDGVFTNGQRGIMRSLIETCTQLNKAGYPTEAYFVLMSANDTAKKLGGDKRDFGVFLMFYEQGRRDGLSHASATAKAMASWK